MTAGLDQWGLFINIRYFGHSAFQIVSPGGYRVLIDPYRNLADQPWFLRAFPLTETDLLLVTHDHFDHDAIDRATGWYSLIRGPGRVQIADVVAEGYLDEHVAGHGSTRLANTILVIECGEIRFCHVGDNRVPVPTGIVDAIGQVDLLTVPVDGSCHLLTYDQVNELVDQFNPKIVLPVHYYIEGLTTVESTLLPSDDWLATQPRVRRIGAEFVEVAPASLPDRREVWLMNPELRELAWPIPASIVVPG